MTVMEKQENATIVFITPQVTLIVAFSPLVYEWFLAELFYNEYLIS